MAIGFSGIMVYYIQAQITCNDVMSEANTSSTLCFSYVDTSKRVVCVCVWCGVFVNYECE